MLFINIFSLKILKICRIKDTTISSDTLPDHINKEIRDKRRGGIEAGSLNKPVIKFSTYIKLKKDELSKTKEIKAVEIGPKQQNDDLILNSILEEAQTSKFEFLLEKL